MALRAMLRARPYVNVMNQRSVLTLNALAPSVTLKPLRKRRLDVEDLREPEFGRIASERT